MFKKTIKFEDFEGDEVEEDFYFHLSKAELIEMGADGKLESHIKNIIKAKDGKAIFQEMKNLVGLAVGKRSEDGRSFIKNDEIRNQLIYSAAYDELIISLVTDQNASVEFIENLVPRKMQEDIKKQLTVEGAAPVQDPFVEKEDTREPWEKEHRDPTESELRSMTPEQMKAAFARKLGLSK